MVRPKAQFELPAFSKRLLIIVGGYGSGKSEVAVNLARYLATSTSRSIAIADLDIVNPYFRSRKATRLLAAYGVEAVNPSGDLEHADLPVIIPRVKGVVESYDGTVILDVGGDDVDARVLSSLTDAFPMGDYEMLLVLNANRPFTATVDDCLALMSKIEATSRLKFTGLIANTHMLEHTTTETVLSGLQLTRDLSTRTALPIAFVSVTGNLIGQFTSFDIDVPVLSLDRLLLKPWERGSGTTAGRAPREE